jgi:hypothetical protein
VENFVFCRRFTNFGSQVIERSVVHAVNLWTERYFNGVALSQFDCRNMSDSL